MTAPHPFTHPLDPPLALSRHAHDRIGDHRVDDAWLAERWADDRTRVLLLHGGQVAVTAEQVPAFVAPSRTGPGARLLLGEEGGTTYFAILLDDPPDGFELVSLRAIAAGLGDLDAGLLVHAVGMANWHHTHRHCSRCGGRLQPEVAGHVLRCADCGRTQFPRTDPAVIMLVIDDRDRCLLGHNKHSPRPRGFSTLAGFVEPGESLEHAVTREIAEEVGVRADRVTYFGSQPWPLPASLMVGFYARANTTEITVDGDEIGEARWFTRAELMAEATNGDVVLPGHVSIARRLIEDWYGGELPGTW